jgi:translation initiation factor IF-1
MVGRLVIDVNRVLEGVPGSFGDIVVRDGGKLSVHKETQEITILGEVQSPTSQVFQRGFSRDDYIAKSGGVTQMADRKRIYVGRANGDVIANGRSGWFRRTRSLEMRPGDTIVVPLDAERVRALPLWTAVTTIMYNIAIALLALKTL